MKNHILILRTNVDPLNGFPDAKEQQRISAIGNLQWILGRIAVEIIPKPPQGILPIAVYHATTDALLQALARSGPFPERVTLEVFDLESPVTPQAAREPGGRCVAPSPSVTIEV